MIIAVDVDGVVADLLSVWLDRYNHDWEDELIVSDITEWNLHEFVKKECGTAVYDYLSLPELYDDIKPIDGAFTGVNILRELGHRVVFATSTLIGSSGAKYNWLVKWDFLEDGNIKDYMEVSDKSLIHADLLFDDAFHNVENFSGKGVLYTALYNKQHVWKYRANNWFDFHYKLRNGDF